MTESTPGRFVWYDLLTLDPKAAVAFYSDVVGWTSQPFERGYTMFLGSQGPLGGAVELPDQARKTPPHWTANVQVADVDATVAQVRTLGGRVLVEPNDFPNVGRLAVIADPQGASVNVFKPNRGMVLHDTSKAGEFVWHELMTTDHEAALAFYAKLFGWTRSRDFDMGPMGAYLIYGLDGVELGGMMTKPKSVPAPPHWLYYAQIADLERAIERAKGKGAKLLNGPMEVPGGARVAQLTDPQGAAFALHEAAKKKKA